MSEETPIDLAVVRQILLVGGPSDAAWQNQLARLATAKVKDRRRAVVLAEQLAITIGFHHMLAGMNAEVPGPCDDAITILAEIEAASA